jgi:hypothetical protein
MFARFLAFSASLVIVVADGDPKEFSFHLTSGNRQSLALGLDSDQSFVVTSLADGQAIANGVSVGDRLVSANGESSERKSNYWMVSHFEKRPLDLVFRYGSKAEQDCTSEQLAKAYEYVEKGEVLNMRKIMEDFKCDLNQDIEGKSPLMHLAAEKGKVSLIKVAAFYGAKTKRVFEGDQPIHVASKFGNAFAVHVLAVEGADVNAKNADGLTPFQLGCKHGQTEVLKVLRQEQADWTATTADGKTAYDLAKENGGEKIIELMDKMLADKAKTDKEQFDSLLKGGEL